MKKILIAVLLMITLFSLTACGNEGKIKNALQGSWGATWTAIGKKIERYYIFKGDQYTTYGVSTMGEFEDSGKYEIDEENSVIIVGSTKLAYSYYDGNLVLWWNDQVQLEKGKTSINYR